MTRKLVHVISKGEVGGAQTSLLNYVTALNARYDQFVYIGSKNKFLGSMLVEKGINHVHYDFKSLVEVLRFAISLRSFVKLNKPEILTHSFVASAITRLLLIGTRTKIIYVVHGFVGNPAVHPIKRYFGIIIEKLLRQGVREYIAITYYEQCLIGKILKRNASIIPNTVKIDIFEPHSTANKHSIICLSRFAKPKRNLLIVEAFLESKLVNHPNFVLKFFGTGPDLETCKMSVGKEILNIEFHRPVENVSEVLQSAGSLILMSDHEGLPMTILEGLAHDIPIVCSQIPELTTSFQQSDCLNIKFCANNQNALVNLFNEYQHWLTQVKKGSNQRYFEENYGYKVISELINEKI